MEKEIKPPPFFTSVDSSDNEIKKVPFLRLGLPRVQPIKEKIYSTKQFQVKETFIKSAIFQSLSFQ